MLPRASPVRQRAGPEMEGFDVQDGGFLCGCTEHRVFPVSEKRGVLSAGIAVQPSRKRWLPRCLS